MLRKMIRAAHADDFDAIAAITNHYIATTAIHFAYDPVAADDLRAAWHEHPRHPYLVDDDGTRLLAYAKSTPWRERAAYAWTAEVGIYVAHDARGHRLGTTLYTALLDELAARGFRSAVAGITLPNDPSLALHARLGFEAVGTFREAGYKMGAWHDVAFFQKPLSTSKEPPVL
jgi:L-amino acid N-acyltransferase YncA